MAMSEQDKASLQELSVQEASSKAHVISLDVYRAERLIQKKLREAFGFMPNVEVLIQEAFTHVPRQEGWTFAEVMRAVEEHIMDQVLRQFATNPAFQQDLVNQTLASLETELALLEEKADMLVVSLTCTHCEHQTQEELETGCRTFLRGQEGGRFFGVGDVFALVPGDVPASFYVEISAVGVSPLVRVLELWHCPACWRESWVEVIVARDEERLFRLAAVRTVELTLDAFDRAHFVAADCVSLAAKLTARDPNELTHKDVVRILRDRLMPL